MKFEDTDKNQTKPTKLGLATTNSTLIQGINRYQSKSTELKWKGNDSSLEKT